MRVSSSRGFILVELLVVIFILILGAAGAGLWLLDRGQAEMSEPLLDGSVRAVRTGVPVFSQNPDGPTVFLPDGRILAGGRLQLDGPWLDPRAEDPEGLE